MSSYRVYCLDGAGQISLADWIDAESDEDAITKARSTCPDKGRSEVWHRKLLIAKINSQGVERFPR